MSVTGPAEQAVDVAAALAHHKNLGIMWHLLYDLEWQVSINFIWQQTSPAVARYLERQAGSDCACAGQPTSLVLLPAILQLSTADLETLLVDALNDKDPKEEVQPIVQEADVAAVQLHVKRLAERAFWAALEVSNLLKGCAVPWRMMAG